MPDPYADDPYADDPYAPPPSAQERAYLNALEQSRQRDARVMRLIPGTGFLPAQKGQQSNRQSQALLQGYTFNTADELASALAATRAGVSNMFGSKSGITPRQAYDARMRLEQEQMQQFRQEHPGQAAAIGITGSVLNPATYAGAGWAAKGATAPSVIGRSALVGGAGGALAGAGAGSDLSTRALGAAGGAATGAALGGATSAVGTKIAKTLADRATIRSAPTVAQREAAAQSLYNQAENAGVIIKRSSINQFSNDLTKDMANEGITPALHPQAFEALKRINALKNNLTLKGAEQERRILQNRVSDAAASARTTGQRDDLRLARVIVDKYDDFIEKLPPQATLAGTSSAPAVSLLKEARKVYATKAKGETIENIIQKARTNSNITTFEFELRKEFRKLANNQRGISRFSPEEQKAIRNVANGTLARNALTTLGRLAPSMSPSGSIVGGAEVVAALLGNVAPVLKVLTVGVPAKVASNASTANAAQMARALALGARPVAPNLRPAAAVAGQTTAAMRGANQGSRSQ
jgi:hypothetical protein